MDEAPKFDMPKLLASLIKATQGAEKKFSQRGLSLAASGGTSKDLVRDLFRKGIQQPDFKTVAGLVTAMGDDLADYILDAAPDARGRKIRITIKGAVEAGVWHDHDQWPPDEWYDFTFDDDEPVVGLRCGFEVRGRSMELSLPPGMVLDCVVLMGSDQTVEDGDYVIVERRQGALFEKTVKLLSLRDDGNWELRCESTLPEFRDPIFIGRPDFHDEADHEVRVVAKVLEARRSFRKRRRIRVLTA